MCSLRTRPGNTVGDRLLVARPLCKIHHFPKHPMLLLLLPLILPPTSSSYFQLVSSSSELGPRTRPASPPRGSEATENNLRISSLSVKKGGLWDLPRNIYQLHGAFSHSQKLVNSKKTMQYLFLRNYSLWFMQNSCLNVFYVPRNECFLSSVKSF